MADLDREERLAARLAALSDRRSAAAPTTAGPTNAGRRSDAASDVARSRRHHPAQGARVAALGLSLVTTGGLATLFAVTNAGNGTELQGATVVSPAVTPANATSSNETPQLVHLDVPAPASPAPAPATTPAPTPATTPAPTTTTNTVVDGGVFHNKWGDVQVRVTFAPDGSLLDVTTLQTPYRDGKSVRINERAVPRLIAEALTAQSAAVDTVSGATYTSNDYRRSLQSAIDAAAEAGVAVAAA